MAGESRSERLGDWFRGPLFLLYINYFSVTWGNRMWNFALGLFFVNIADQELRLTAIYGFAMGGSVLLFGGMVGNWVDRTNRLTAVRTSIIIQKVSVALCAAVICLLLLFQADVKSLWDGWLYVLCQGLVVVLAIIAELATMSYLRIELEKDWFIVVTDGKKAKLANLNASTRAVDLITNIVTPIVTGQIMTSMSQVIAGVTIVVWHLLAIVIEFILLTQIYKKVPQMAQKNTEQEEQQHLNITEEKEMSIKPRSSSMNGHVNSHENHMDKEQEANQSDGQNKHGCCHVICSPCTILWTGWKTYARQLVVFAGLSLALLYMTVLGFDGITVGYIYGNGIQENMVGVVMAVGSLAGVLGAFLYTQFRKCLGLERTGLVSLTWQSCCLILCVLSVWLPGSPFRPETLWKGHQEVNATSGEAGDLLWCSNTSQILFTHSDNSGSSKNEATILNAFNSSYSDFDSLNVTTLGGNATDCTATEAEGSSIISQSITVFLVGITSSRIGLYLTDLVICQIQQENVPERERGIVNGVQNSLNNFMDMLKFILVIFLPRIETFGFLIILSYLAVTTACLFYAYHCFRVSQHSIIRCLAGKTVTSTKEVIAVDV